MTAPVDPSGRISFGPEGDAEFQKARGQVEAYETLKKLVAEAEQDMPKAAGGNKAAQTRVRKLMQDIKEAAQEVRSGLLELRKQDPQGPQEPKEGQ